jgi:hypothetical protein
MRRLDLYIIELDWENRESCDSTNFVRRVLVVSQTSIEGWDSFPRQVKRPSQFVLMQLE